MVAHLGLTDQVLVSPAHIKLQALVAAAVNGVALDMQGWDGVTFVIPYGVFGASGTLTGLVQRDDNSGFNTPTNIASSSITQVNAANANAGVAVDVYQPSERYVRLQLTGQTNGVTAGAVAIQYRRTGILPATQTLAEVVKVSAGG